MLVGSDTCECAGGVCEATRDQPDLTTAKGNLGILRHIQAPTFEQWSKNKCRDII